MPVVRKEYVIPVKLDAKTFRRFSRFDILRLRMRWSRPTLFAVILLAFSAAAFLSKKPQSGLIGGVLLAVGLGLPAVYFATFFHQINAQVKRWNLETPRAVYTVTLNADGLHVVNDQRQEDPLQLPWKDVRMAFRDGHCIYLYVTAMKAFLLPEGQGGVDQDELWAYLVKHMGERCRDKR